MARCAIPDETDDAGDGGGDLDGLEAGPGIGVEQAGPDTVRVSVALSDDPGQALGFDPGGRLYGSGTAGQAGPVARGYAHTQTTAGTVWTITHDLGYDPAGLLVIDAGGVVLDDFGVQYLTAGAALRLSFDVAVSGTAYLS